MSAMRGRRWDEIEIMNLDDIIEKRIRDCGNLSELAFILRMLFENHSVSADGQLLSYRALVGYANGLRIEIHPNEHAPAHFHVRAQDIDASFSIEECLLLEGRIGSREQDLVRFWYKHSRQRLVQIWNETRPSDCPVGPRQS
jgi:hypothetical protein